MNTDINKPATDINEGHSQEPPAYSSYVFDFPSTPPSFYWLLATIVIAGNLLLWSNWVDEYQVVPASSGFVLGFLCLMIFADYFIRIPVGKVRSLNRSGNLNLIKQRSPLNFLIRFRLRAMGFGLRTTGIWIVAYFIIYFILGPNIIESGENDPYGPYGMVFEFLIPGFIALMLILESGILASTFGKPPYSSIPIVLFWTIPVLYGAFRAGVTYAEPIVIARVAAHVDTSYVPDYWKSTVSGIEEMTVMMICALLATGWLITFIISTWLSRRLIDRKLLQLLPAENASPSA